MILVKLRLWLARRRARTDRQSGPQRPCGAVPVNARLSQPQSPPGSKSRCGILVNHHEGSKPSHGKCCGRCEFPGSQKCRCSVIGSVDGLRGDRSFFVAVVLSCEASYQLRDKVEFPATGERSAKRVGRPCGDGKMSKPTRRSFSGEIKRDAMVLGARKTLTPATHRCGGHSQISVPLLGHPYSTREMALALGRSENAVPVSSGRPFMPDRSRGTTLPRFAIRTDCPPRSGPLS